MKVKVGNRIYDGALEPVMVILSEKDKANIIAMGDRTKYLSYPLEMSADAAEEFMVMAQDKPTVE